MSAAKPLKDFHHPKSFVKGPDDLWQLPLESLQQHLLTAVADAHPRQFSGVALSVGEMKKILVLAHHNPVAGRGVMPNFEVGGFLQVSGRGHVRIRVCARSIIGKGLPEVGCPPGTSHTGKHDVIR